MQTPPDSKLRIGLATDVGSYAGGTFNQYAYEGMTRAAQEHGLEFDAVETKSPADYDSNIRQLIERGCSLIVTIGSTTGQLVERLAKSYPSTHFIVVDYEPAPESRNITGLVFAEDQAGFLAGALAGLITQQDVVGFVGGIDVPPVRKFQRGFEHGVASINRRAKVVPAYTQSFSDIQAGEAAANALREQGVDVIFAAAGLSGSQAILTAARQAIWVIGVDQDEWGSTFQGGQASGSERLLTSAVKQVSQAVYTAVVQAIQGKLHGGLLHFDLANDGVGLAPYHAADTAVPSEVRGKILDVIEGLRMGRIHTQVGPHGEDLREGLLQRLVSGNWQPVLMPLLAVFTALVVGAVFIVGFNPAVWAAFGQGFGTGLAAAWDLISRAYSALFSGAFGDPVAIKDAVVFYVQTGDSAQLIQATRYLAESLRISTPYIFAGLAVALGFRCGLFNIGAEGQYFLGGLASVFVGYSLVGFPWFIHLPLALLAAMIGGALWGGIAGYLKAKTGAHEVINTIMLNWIAIRLQEYLLGVGGLMSRPGASLPMSPMIQPSAYLPWFFPEHSTETTLNIGLLLALFAVFFVYWLLFKTTLGFEIRAVGANPRAARTAGINVPRNFVLAMLLSGGLAGLAGAHDILGVSHYMSYSFVAGYGFDAIALALLGRSHPVGVLLAALLWGFLRNGARAMQSVVPLDIIYVLQGLIIIFVAAPEIVRLIYRLRARRETAETVLTRGWGL